MQITNSVVCDASKGCIYKQIKPPLVGEHAFPLTGFVCIAAHVTFGGSGVIRSTARPELPYPCNSQAKSRVGTSLRGGVMWRFGVTDINRSANHKLGSLRCE